MQRSLRTPIQSEFNDVVISKTWSTHSPTCAPRRTSRKPTAPSEPAHSRLPALHLVSRRPGCFPHSSLPFDPGFPPWASVRRSLRSLQQEPFIRTVALAPLLSRAFPRLTCDAQPVRRPDAADVAGTHAAAWRSCGKKSRSHVPARTTNDASASDALIQGSSGVRNDGGAAGDRAEQSFDHWLRALCLKHSARSVVEAAYRSKNTSRKLLGGLLTTSTSCGVRN